MPNPEYKYSNGLDVSLLIPALKDRVKWKSAVEPSESGRYFDDGSFHAVVTEAAFKNVQPNPSIDNTAFANLKDELSASAIHRAIAAVFDKQEVIEQTLLHNIIQSRLVTRLPLSDFAGIMITVAPDMDVSLQVLSAVLHFDMAATFKLYAYEDGSQTPFWEQEVDAESGRYAIVALDDLILSYSRNHVTQFYIGYKPSELPTGAKPYADDILSLETCVFDATIIESSLPIQDGSISYPASSIGLNLEIKSFYDFTQRIVSAPGVFDELIGLTHAAMIIEQILFSSRKNAEQRSAADNSERFALQLELAGTLPVSDAPHIIGLRQKIAQQTLKVRESFLRKQTGVISYASY